MSVSNPTLRQRKARVGHPGFVVTTAKYIEGFRFPFRRLRESVTMTSWFLDVVVEGITFVSSAMRRS